MAGEHVGFVDCAECGAQSPVRVNKNNKKFYLCPSCGLIYPNTKEGQARLEKRFRVEEKKGGVEVAAGVGIVSPAPSSEVKTTPAPTEPVTVAPLAEDPPPEKKEPRRRFGVER